MSKVEQRTNNASMQLSTTHDHIVFKLGGRHPREATLLVLETCFGKNVRVKTKHVVGRVGWQRKVVAVGLDVELDGWQW